MFVRCHQSEAQRVDTNYGNRVRLINSDKVEEITDILNAFDLLITDYSSIYIDYLLTSKPVMFLPYDIDEYSKGRGFNFDYDAVTPGPKPSTFSQFQSEIMKLLYNPDYYTEERQNVNFFFSDVRRPCAREICSKIKKEIEIIQETIRQ